uniref:Peptidyl-tRNA hydrolase n=1 Tax=Thermofilum pendens TaxID=2269 RepID=A0A7C3WK96_THEPE
MGRGKMVAQGAHASLSAFLKAWRSRRDWAVEWLRSGQKKVVVRVDSLEELVEVYRRARALELPVAVVKDRGLTQVPPGTVTALGIGPAPADLVDKVTGHLKLL